MKTKIEKFDVDGLNIKNLCRETVSMGKSELEPTQEWKRKLLIARHSPLRAGEIQWRWEQIPYAISTHFARHVHSEKWVSTSRADRTEIKDRSKRSQMDNVSMIMRSNIDALQAMAEKRLCFQADPLTRAYMQNLVEVIQEYDEDLAWSLVPSCIRTGGCIELFGKCKFYDDLMKDATKEEQMDVIKRYDIYNARRK
jgi:hypothetical protein